MESVGINLSDYDYTLPQELIAQRPAERRDASRLMVLHRPTGKIEHRRFSDITDYLGSQDLLVLNNTRVMPARLLGRKRGSGGEAELLLLHAEETARWSCLARPGSRLGPGAVVEFAHGLSAEIKERRDKGQRLVEFRREGRPLGTDELMAILDEVGHVPLPPYIIRPDEKSDRDRYQTVYAKEPGSVAAPTAGLHFTQELLDRIRGKGVEIVELLLHVGWGTFKTVEAEKIKDHRMDKEYYRIDRETARKLSWARNEGRRVVAVGTTVVRALESFAASGNNEGWTEIFIHPPHKFGLVDALVTNFHLPRSTMLMLVCALAGIDLIKRAYAEAVEKKYRFYSYGDAMLIV